MSESYDELVRKGRERLTKEQQAERDSESAAANAKADYKARRDIRAQRLLTIPALRSVSWVANLVVVAVFAAPFVGIVGYAAFASAEAVIIPALVTLACTGWLEMARRRLLALTASLPFAVEGFGIALDYPRSYPSTTLELVFADEVAPSGEVYALLNSVRSAFRQQRATCAEVQGTTITVEVDSETGSKFDGHRRWLARWWRAVARGPLIALHGKYPLARVRFPH